MDAHAGSLPLDATLLQYALIAGLGLLAVLFIVRSRQTQYKGHVKQLQPKRRLRELTVGTRTRADVAAHSSLDDCWLIIRDKEDGKLKVWLAARRSRHVPDGG